MNADMDITAQTRTAQTQTGKNGWPHVERLVNLSPKCRDSTKVH